MSTADPYLYPDTEVLRNKLGIRDQTRLEQAEANYTVLRLREIIDTPYTGEFDVAHFCHLHREIFGDIYDWAGNFRTINIYKEEPVLSGYSVEYSDFHNISKDLSECLDSLKSYCWANHHDDLARRLSCFLAALWKIHPFREGNTRTVVTFICQFATVNELPLNYTLLEQNSTYLRTALVAYNAIIDGVNYSKAEYLERIISDALSNRF